MRRIFIVIATVLLSIQSDAQDQLLDDLSYYGDVMVNAYEAKHRIRAKAEFDVLIDRYVTEGHYKTDDWAALEPYSRQQESEDESLFIITYQVNTGVYPYVYGGYVIHNEQVTKLNHESVLDPDSQYQAYGAEDWYGALYYNLLPIKGNPNSYLLFGYQYTKEFDKTKLIDVITLDANGITFGKEIFITRADEGRDDVKQRFILEYSSDTNASLNYNESIDMIIFDHLMPRMGQQAGQGNTYVPDGTYEGYQFEKGSFVYVEKIFDHIYEEAPRPEPVLNNQGGSKKDIMGKEKRTSKSRN